MEQIIIAKDGKNQMSIQKKTAIRGFVYEITNCVTGGIMGNFSEKKFNALMKNSEADPTIEIKRYER